MDSDIKTNDQFEYLKNIHEMIQNKTNEYQKLLKSLENKMYTHNSTGPLYPDVTMIHPISPWTFWYRNSKKLQMTNQWEKSLIKIETIQDITHLWKVLNHIIQPSIKFANSSLFVFKKNSIPAWEHESNQNAGCWILILNNNHNLDKIWNNMILEVVGDKFEAVASDVNGIGLHIKYVGSKITVWTTKPTLENYRNILTIG
ncbi:Translation Initiation factor eIF-4e,Translation Initiation factor eIF- 4e-like [Cinara cedri]|uniref:Translation Initiation factor eIF-4e,Translation Initiation factor eIF- 4e-like n=1 Tax=Cinara cedri TaxID=506608 RepID=A0A5E4MYH8_9HEMI|nr:Translation Initiation factor eIF-4e,Translation Initiation factor eIF- 4e-like [Cinara cedri]